MRIRTIVVAGLMLGVGAEARAVTLAAGNTCVSAVRAY